MCISYIFVASIKHDNQKQLMEVRIYFGLLFPREGSQWQEGMVAGRWGRKQRDQVFQQKHQVQKEQG